MTHSRRFDGRAGRLAVAVVCGALAALACYHFNARSGAAQRPSDFAQVLVGARELFAGRDPYAAVGPGRAFEWHTGLLYPAPALVLAAPIAALPLHAAEAAFAGLSVALLAYGLAGRGPWALLWCASPPVLLAVNVVQWSPLLTAAALIPALSAVAAVKPTTGLIPVAYRPSWWPVVGAAVLGLVSFALLPDWPSRWVAALGAPSTQAGVTGQVATSYSALVGQPAGWVVLLALLRWRRPEARALVALGCVPQTLLQYEMVPLVLVASSAVEVVGLLALAYVATAVIDAGYPYPSWAATFAATARAEVWCLLVPATLLVLRRPNVGPAPAWLERRLASWRAPAWLRGTPVDRADEGHGGWRRVVPVRSAAP